MKFKPPRPHLRSKFLLQAQQLKMARSAHAYVRGNTIRFYEWLHHRSWRNLATERIEDVRPSIPLGRRFWALTKTETASICKLFELPEIKALVTCLRERDPNDPIEVLDAAYWMKGCSSLGRLRYAVLIGVGKSLCLIDIKEATPAAAPGRKTPGIPRDPAQRLVAGARALSPFLGERMVAAKINGTPVVIRELRPQDLKFEFARITQAEALTTARFLASVVGKAHARQMDTATRRKWLAQLNKRQSRAIGAPSWLWQCAVELVAAHELAYLEHCRRYVLSDK